MTEWIDGMPAVSPFIVSGMRASPADEVVYSICGVCDCYFETIALARDFLTALT